MEKNLVKVQKRRERRSARIRSHVRGTKTCPRMCVVKSNKHIEVQLIDDENGFTVASETTKSNELKKTEHGKKSKEAAKVLGQRVAQKAKALGIEQVVFDRGPFTYHGILAELADQARASGLKF